MRGTSARRHQTKFGRSFLPRRSSPIRSKSNCEMPAHWASRPSRETPPQSSLLRSVPTRRTDILEPTKAPSSPPRTKPSNRSIRNYGLFFPEVGPFPPTHEISGQIGRTHRTDRKNFPQTPTTISQSTRIQAFRFQWGRSLTDSSTFGSSNRGAHHRPGSSCYHSPPQTITSFSTLVIEAP